jgi:hypothetical protein
MRFQSLQILQIDSYSTLKIRKTISSHRTRNTGGQKHNLSRRAQQDNTYYIVLQQFHSIYLIFNV